MLGLLCDTPPVLQTTAWSCHLYSLVYFWWTRVRQTYVDHLCTSVYHLIVSAKNLTKEQHRHMGSINPSEWFLLFVPITIFCFF